MPMNLACCFIHAVYECKSEREKTDRVEGGGEKEMNKGRKEREKKMEMRRATGEREIGGKSVIKTAADLFTLCATHSN